MGSTCSKDDTSSSASILPRTGTQKVPKSSSILRKSQDIREYYNFDRILGQGHFGIVRSVIEKTTGTSYACKSISKRKLGSKEEIEDVRREIQILYHLFGNEHVVEFKAAYEDKHHIHLVMELCQGGELFENIVKRDHYSERDAAAVMRQILHAVAHCHSMGVIHRDLKPENFLLAAAAAPGGQPRIKATDFGLSTWLKDGEVLTDVLGSPFYIAPEVLSRSYSTAADIWSCGVILYTILCGWPPFYGETTTAIFNAVKHQPLDFDSPPWDAISDAAKDCVRSMLTRNPKARPTAADVLRHAWMVENGVAPDEPLQVEVLTRMKKFSAMNKFKREVVRVMVGTLPCEELVGLQEMFAAMDRDHSGQVTVEELQDGLHARGANVTSAEIQKLVAAMDVDGNNSLDVQEFVTATINLSRLERDDNLFTTFAHFDKDRSGFISRAELLQALQQFPDAATNLDTILAEVDRNGDGRIDYEEFCNMFRGGSTSSGLATAATQLRRGILVDVPAS